ncbi:uncharacterized protein [Anabrus simplex]|uniref:uncharacterized protein isoform X2 n=1 Tax=Anabrus simplex TaxID=316456 RepID=UPI0034DCD22B
MMKLMNIVAILTWLQVALVSAQFVKKYGESCFFDVQCVDHRMTCREDNSSTPVVKTCLCDRFHAWSEELQECVQAHNTTVILSTLKVANSLEHIQFEGQNVFSWIVAAGLTVAALLAVIALVLIVYGCCLYECYDRCTGDYIDIENSRCSGECRRYR